MDFISESKLSIREFERRCGLSNGYIKALRKYPTTDKMRSILDAFPELSQQWLLTGEGEMLNSNTEVANNTQTLPLIPIDAMAGALSGSSQTFMEYDCEQYVVPVFNGADFLIRVQGDSMTPKFESGDIVACKRVPLDRLWFQWGKVYVIDTDQGALVKRMEPSEQEGCVSIHSENKKYKPFDLPTEEIYGVALVVGVIRVE